MHKLSLDTLSEDRIKNSVDKDTYALGQHLFANGLVQVTEVMEVSALCVVTDKRRYHVQIKIGLNHLYLKCTCRHASRGLVCEHDVAAWLAIREHLLRQLPSAWQLQLDRVIDSAQPTPARNITKTYLLSFSLQEDFTTGIPSWKISPYQLPLSAIPEEMRQAIRSMDTQLLSQFIETITPGLALRFRSPHHVLNPGECLNCTPQIVNLANIIFERNHANAYGVRFPLEEYLPLLSSTKSPLFFGTEIDPIQKALTIAAEPGIVRLALDRTQAGLRICARIAVADQSLDVGPGDIRVLQTSPFWVVVNRSVIEIKNPAGAGLITTFLGAPELHIPANQEQDFLEKYYLGLARQFPLEGEIVSWEVVTSNPVPRLYLTDVNGELQAQLRVVYGEVEVAYLPDLPSETILRKPDSWTLIRIERQPEMERAFFERLSTPAYGLKRAPLPGKPGLFRLRVRTHPVDFLLNCIPDLVKDGFDIFGEEQLKTARVNRNTPSISFKISSGIDWFDVRAVVNFGELEVSLKDIRRVIRKKERFIKLADGTIGEIPADWFERYKHLFVFGEVSGENLRFSRQHLTLIDEALSNAAQIEADAEFENRREKLRLLADSGFKGVAPVDLPEGFFGDLRPYQKAGYDWLHFLHEFDYGGCLADDMGLGKTIQTLVFMQSIYGGRPGTPPPQQASLLVVPRSLLINWQRESARFTPHLRILEYFDPNRTKDGASFDQVDLVITTYGVMLRDIQFLHGYFFYYSILDESQAIKNPLSQTARAAHLLQSAHRLVLTGTPIENSTSELWSQFAFLNPGLLGNLTYFKTEFGTPIEKKSDENAVHALRKLVYPFILRRTKDLVAPELPPRSERLLYSDMEPAQRKFYIRTRDYYRGMLLGLLEKEGLNESRIKILEGLLRLRQISNHPLLVDKKFHGESGKFELLMETLETLKAEGHKALVFSQFVQMLSLVRQELDSRGIRYAYLDGQTQNRQEQVDNFQSDRTLELFLISLKAGGLGLNLTAADYVIHIDPWWNPAVEMQASDRTHRIGQDKPVFVFKLIARDSVEEKILVLQERKRNLVDQIITTESAFFKNLTIEDINVLFG